MSSYIGLDFETYGACDLPTHGLDRYVSDKTFMPLIGSIACRDLEGAKLVKNTFNFVSDKRASRRELSNTLTNRLICAHNAPFEQAVLDHMNISLPAERFIDSAVVARAAGGGSGLEAAAPQLLGVDKMASGWDLIKLFSIPGKYQEANGSQHFDPSIIADHLGEWTQFCVYCELDAELSLRLVESYFSRLSSTEMDYQALTMQMNNTGWPVDVALVEEMQRRYLENQEQALFQFRDEHNATDLNLNSLKQLKEFCAARGIKASSFDEKHVATLHSRISKKLGDPMLAPGKVQNYGEVIDLLETKQVLGGSSLKKLKTILDTVGSDGRLRDQYLHCGAGQTLRTTGRSVQMQNLKRLPGEPGNVEQLFNPDVNWDNTEMALNLRQVFTSSEPKGQLVVGDLSSVESRGLAWLAGADWKLAEFRRGLDMYKVQAEKIFGVSYDLVSKVQRSTGKVGELSCGYGAGGEAVHAFAQNIGVDMSEGEATKLVSDWRTTNPEIVGLWWNLDDMLHSVVENGGVERLGLYNGFCLKLKRIWTPDSLLDQHPGATSIEMKIMNDHDGAVMRRYFHGCYSRGGNIAYYKPSDRKTGDLWRPTFVDPKTKQTRFFELYGGKLAGILTQSLCREVFFRILRRVYEWTSLIPNVTPIGQFHDEIVLDWVPGDISLKDCSDGLEVLMSDPGIFKTLPLAAEVKHSYRYTK